MARFIHQHRHLLVVLVGLGLAVAFFPQETAAASRKSREVFFGVTPRMDGAELDAIRELLIAIDEECPKAEQKCPAVAQLLS